MPSPVDAPSELPVAAVPFTAALRVWCRVAALSLGGPAGQIAVMQRILVDELGRIHAQKGRLERAESAIADQLRRRHVRHAEGRHWAVRVAQAGGEPCLEPLPGSGADPGPKLAA